jgi:hypothetical protein
MTTSTRPSTSRKRAPNPAATGSGSAASASEREVLVADFGKRLAATARRTHKPVAPRTQDGLVDRFLDLVGDDLVFVPDEGTFHRFDGVRWLPDRSGWVALRAWAVTRAVEAEADALGDRQAWRKWLTAVGTVSTQAAIVSGLRHRLGFDSGAFDSPRD